MTMILKSSVAAIGLAVITITGWVGTNILGTVEGTERVSETRIGTNIGDEAPDIVMNNPDGVQMKLSDLRGQLVLVDFWASWCGPCRRENPNVVRLYNEYKSKGFTVFSVSLDHDKSKWINAIEKDKLSWPNHVSDLKRWQSDPARIYQVKGIPTTFLIDQNGVVIGKNLRGEALDKKLKELFN